MKIEFTVPDGEYCLDCPQQEDFRVEAIETTCFGDPYSRYIRTIVANCRLFNQPIRGVALAEMRKCRDCLNSGK